MEVTHRSEHYKNLPNKHSCPQELWDGLTYSQQYYYNCFRDEALYERICADGQAIPVPFWNFMIHNLAMVAAKI